jgi:hypothetical protein
MAWNETDRGKYAVIRERYASDLSDEEFALIQPLLPDPKPLGRKPTDARSSNRGKTPGGPEIRRAGRGIGQVAAMVG